MKIKLYLKNLGCVACAAKIERKTAKLEGVKNASLNFITSRLLLEVADGHEEEIAEKVRGIASATERGVVVLRV